MRHIPIVLLLSIAACQSGNQEAKEASVAAPAAKVTYTADGEPEGLHRFIRWSDKLVQGAQPEGDKAFRNLAAMGVTTVISVDGSSPDIETAHKYDLIYVHAPIGYDGVPREQALVIIEAVRQAKGSVYVHCHHGKHRGPAGMMVARLTLEGITHQQAVEALKKSGTSPKYEGLYKDIREFKIPSDAELAMAPKTLPERVMPDGMRATMVDVSHRWEFIKASRSEEWRVPAAHPDVSPAHEARMLWELYRESARSGQGKTYCEDDTFTNYLAAGEKAAVDLEKALRAGDQKLADRHYKTLKNNCASCHAQFRN